MAVDARADVLGHLTLEQLRCRGGEFDDLRTALDLALGIRKHLAVLGGDDGGKFVGALLEDAQELVEDAGAAQRRRRGPAGKRLPGDGNGRIHLCGGGEGDAAGLLARGGVEDGRGAARSGHVAAADEKGNGLGHGSPPECQASYALFNFAQQ